MPFDPAIVNLPAPGGVVTGISAHATCIGSNVRGLAQTEPLHTIYVDMPLPEVLDFELWLDQNSEGQGRLEVDDSANDGSA